MEIVFQVLIHWMELHLWSRYKYYGFYQLAFQLGVLPSCIYWVKSPTFQHYWLEYQQVLREKALYKGEQKVIKDKLA